MWKGIGDDLMYKSLWGIEYDRRLMDKLFHKLFTRIGDNYKK